MPPFAPSDFQPTNQLVSALLTSTRTAPQKYLDLQSPLKTLHALLNELTLQSYSPLSILLQRCQDRHREWLILSSRLHTTLLSIQDCIKRSCKSAWTRWFRFPPRKCSSLKHLKRELRSDVDEVDVFVSSLGLSALGRQDVVLGRMERLLLEEVREERKGERGLAVLAAHETNDPVVWREVGRILMGRGVEEEDLWKHDARLKQLLHWVVKNEPDITAALELQDAEAEKIGDRTYDRKM